MSWRVGELWKLTATITDPSKSEELVDPSTVVATITDPEGTVTTPSVTKASKGVYTLSVSLTKPGNWHAAWTTTGSYQAAKSISVRALED